MAVTSLLFTMLVAAVVHRSSSTNTCVTDFPPNYQTFPAKDKLDILWDKVLASQYSFNYLPTTFDASVLNLTLQTVPEFLAISFTHLEDEQPPGRTRLNAMVFGVVAKITFRTYKNT